MRKRSVENTITKSIRTTHAAQFIRRISEAEMSHYRIPDHVRRAPLQSLWLLFVVLVVGTPAQSASALSCPPSAAPPVQSRPCSAPTGQQLIPGALQTNWDAATQQFQLGGLDPDVRYLTHRPTFEHSNGENTDPVAINPAMAGDANGNGVADPIEGFVEAVNAATGRGINIWNGRDFLRSQDAGFGVLENSANLQMLHQMPFRHGTATLYFPPNWASSKPVPVLLATTGYAETLNATILPENGDALYYAKIAARYKVVVILAQCGLENLGSPAIYEDLTNLLKTAANHWHLDLGTPARPRLILQGTSRGALEAFGLLRHLLELHPEVPVAAIYANMVPARVDTLLLAPGIIPLEPSVGGVVDTILDPQNNQAFRVGFDGLSETQKRVLIATILFNTDDPVRIHNQDAIVGAPESVLAKLRQVRVVFTNAMFDAFISNSQGHELYRLFVQQHVPCTFHWLAHGDHASNFEDAFDGIDSLASTLKDVAAGRAITPEHQGLVVWTPSSLTRDRATGELQFGPWVRLDAETLMAARRVDPAFLRGYTVGEVPFAAQIPAKVALTNPRVTVALTGETGRSFRLTADIPGKGAITCAGRFGQAPAPPTCAMMALETTASGVLLSFTLPSGLEGNEHIAWAFLYNGASSASFTSLLKDTDQPVKLQTLILREEPQQLEGYFHPLTPAGAIFSRNFGVTLIPYRVPRE